MRQRISSHRSRQLAERAAEMRANPTASERLVFEALTRAGLGLSFRRQVPLLGRYIADIYVPALRLVIEVDGGSHEARGARDARSDRALERAGYRVMRIRV